MKLGYVSDSNIKQDSSHLILTKPKTYTRKDASNCKLDEFRKKFLSIKNVLREMRNSKRLARAGARVHAELIEPFSIRPPISIQAEDEIGAYRHRCITKNCFNLTDQNWGQVIGGLVMVGCQGSWYLEWGQLSKSFSMPIQLVTYLRQFNSNVFASKFHEKKS